MTATNGYHASLIFGLFSALFLHEAAAKALRTTQAGGR